MRQAGRYQKSYREIREKVDFLTLCHTPALASQVTVDAVDQLGVDAAIIFADILLPLECLGVGLRFAKGDGPVIDSPIAGVEDVARLSLFDVEDGLGYVFESVKLFVRERPLVPLIGFAGAPFTLASYLIEGGSSRNFEKTKIFMYTQEEAFHRLMKLLSEITVRYLLGQAQAGASALMLFDSWAGCLSRADYSRYVMPHSRDIFSALNSPSLHFGTSCGGMLDLMASCGSSAVGVDWRTSLDSSWAQIGFERAVMGNLDPCVLMGPKSLIAERASDVLKAAAGRPGHIFNLGHGILQHSPEENVRYLVDLVKNGGSV